MSFAVKARTIAALGLGNVARVAAYRLGLKSGLGPVRRLKDVEPAIGPFFRPRPSSMQNLPVSHAWETEAVYFGRHRFPIGDGPPDWLKNPITGRRLENADRHWWQIADFDPAIGDIKVIWEASRFDWLLAGAQRAAAGDAAALARLELWLDDWCRRNPPYRGPNWKCGQETSIRVMHLAMAALMLGNEGAPTAGLKRLLDIHLRRIEPTVGYAIGQDNNHGTSEAAALFIGGSWLAANGHPRGRHWEALGRRLLENRVGRLIERDGSFSQYSLTYHRVLLDTLIMAEVWRRRFELEPLSSKARERMAAAARWLFAMIDPRSGDGPNLGANDGARLLPLTDTDYRDFRPTVQAAMTLFCDKRAYAERGSWDAPLAWLGIAAAEAASEPVGSTQFDDGGYAVLRKGVAMALLRYPRFRFRPAQADALHVDLWVEGANILRDAGTFSYNTDAATLDRFAGTAGHNTVQFDGRDQMPRLGRFLYGEWLNAHSVAFDAAQEQASAGYTDWRGATQNRAVQLEANRLTVRDGLSGRFVRAVLRWRLQPGPWKLDGQTLSNGRNTLRIAADVPIARIDLTTGEESLYYLEKHPVPVLEIEVNDPGTLTSELSWP
ncbi:heparinase II/III-family protein [Mesorhizobium sp. 8]|uniref:heparinase II/III family protein n=1 Tax=Mesorhizobium sp. 8 TaxID=2584466 RepID=UPI00112186B7|nr:heparinase II/III-family protein [Mesorhizobium sp. 8]QDC02952.1 heparinase [Mesorhizobium sp. 8]